MPNRRKLKIDIGAPCALMALIFATGGCAPKSEKVAPAAPTPEVVAPAIDPNAPMPRDAVHGMGGPAGGLDAGKAENPTPTLELDAKIAKLEKKGGDKKALAALYTKRGSIRMMDPAASPRVKYRAALKDYRKALTIDPNNKQAMSDKDLIEGIYKSMGRPIPGD